MLAKPAEDAAFANPFRPWYPYDDKERPEAHPGLPAAARVARSLPPGRVRFQS